MEMQQLPTKIVSSAFALVREPVTVVVEHLGPLAPDDIESWKPRLRMEALEGAVKETMGSILHDDHMIESGRSTRRAVERRRDAVRADAVATALADQAQDELVESLDEARAQHDATVQRTTARKRAAAREGAEAIDATRKRARRKEQSVEQRAEETTE